MSYRKTLKAMTTVLLLPLKH